MSSCNPAVPFWEFIALEEITSNTTGKSLSELFGIHDSQDNVYGPLGVSSSEFSPAAADVFDTATSYVIHISLPGAKKEDIWIGFDEVTSKAILLGYESKKKKQKK
jgi:HSP20 family molecular chaperone IbpA